MDLVLASTSPYRRDLLERLGVPFRSMAPASTRTRSRHGTRAQGAGRTARPGQSTEPASLSRMRALSEATRWSPSKAARSASREPKVAVDMLSAMAGKSHELITALVVCTGGARFLPHGCHDAHHETAHEGGDRAIRGFDRPLGCAGAYRLESRGIALFERIESADHTAISAYHSWP